MITPEQFFSAIVIAGLIAGFVFTCGYLFRDVWETHKRIKAYNKWLEEEILELKIHNWITTYMKEHEKKV